MLLTCFNLLSSELFEIVRLVAVLSCVMMKKDHGTCVLRMMMTFIPKKSLIVCIQGSCVGKVVVSMLHDVVK